MHQQRQCVVANAGEKIHDGLPAAGQPPQARALGDVAGGEHAAGDVQGVGNAALQVPCPAVSAPKQHGLAVSGACTAAGGAFLEMFRI